MATPEMQQLSQELQQLTRALQNMVAASSRTVTASRAQFEHLLDVNDQLEDYRKSLTQGRTLDKQQEKIVKEAIALKKKEIEAATKLQKANNELEAATRKTNVSAADLQKRQATVARASKLLGEAQGRTAAAAGTLDASLKGTGKSTILANAGLVLFGKALQAQASMLLAQNAANGGVVEGTNTVAGALLSQQNLGLRYAVAADELARISAANRQVINNMGGTAQTLAVMDKTIDSFRIATGDFDEGIRLAVAAATQFATKGIKPTMIGMQQYTNDLTNLRMRTGMGVKDAMDYFNEIASDADSIEILRKARGSEREAILANQRALVQQSLALGMSAEQAKEAAKMLNKMTAAKPLDRLKQAAKVRAIGGAMGVAGANEAADGIAAGSRATAEQKKAIQDFNVNMANQMDQAAQQGIASEIFATTLVDKLGLEQYFGAGNAFSTSLGDSLKPAMADLSKQYIDVSKTAEGSAALRLAELKKMADLILSGNHWGGLIAGGIAALVAMTAGGKVGGMLGSVGKGVGGMGKDLMGKLGGAGAAAGNAAKGVVASGSTLAKAATTAGKVMKGAGVVGAVADVGMGISDLAQGKAQTELPQGFEKLSPMKWGMYIGDKVNQGVEGAIGQSIGSKLYDVFNPPEEGNTKALETSAAIKDVTTKTADGVTAQVKKMDTSNDLLKQIAEVSKKQLELSEKQLIAMTMTEQERTEKASRTSLRAGNQFGTQYGYV